MTDLLTRIENNQPIEAQELYDFVVAAIVKQGRPSVGDNDRCLYRGPDGLKCAAGHVIPDSVYSEDMEGLDLANMAAFGRRLKSLVPHLKLLVSLQGNHDGAFYAKDFMGKFLATSKIIGRHFNLKPYGETP